MVAVTLEGIRKGSVLPWTLSYISMDYIMCLVC